MKDTPYTLGRRAGPRSEIAPPLDAVGDDDTVEDPAAKIGRLPEAKEAAGAAAGIPID